MGLEDKFSPTEIYIKVVIYKDNRMAKENMNGKME